MPLVAASFSSVSAADFGGAGFWAKIRHRQAVSPSLSIAGGNLLGRERALPILIQRSLSHLAVRPLVFRGARALSESRSFASAGRIATMPVPLPPVAELFYGSAPLAGQYLPAGFSLPIKMSVRGRRLKFLTANFELRSLSGSLYAHKQVRIEPGGIGIDEFIEEADGMQSAVGWVFLQPEDTQRLAVKNTEAQFMLIFQNSFWRHLAAAGTLVLTRRTY